jgi:adenylate cyclase
MAKDQLSRQLAVILHADVVSSTSLVQKNETLAHERIQAAFRQFSETINSYGGITHELRGDALVAEFNRASDAVTAALAFQVMNEAHNATLDHDIQPQLRIGISLGEVIIADNTLTGAGVVLAQRLEQLAEPGGVVVQGSVSETVPIRLPFEFEALGEQTLKGFDQPVRAFKARLQAGEELPEPEANTTKLTKDPTASRVPDKPSIAVLPFVNLSGDTSQVYFSDGITDDIIIELSKFRSLTVIARSSSFSFRGKEMSIASIAKELEVDYIVEGGIRRAGSQIRISAHLVVAESGEQIWGNRYDRELKDIFEIQDEVTGNIVATLGGRLENHRAAVRRRTNSNDWSVYDQILRAQEQHYRTNKDANFDAQEILQQARLVAPENARIYSLLGAIHLMDYVLHWSTDFKLSLQLALENGRTSLRLDNADSLSHARLGETLIHYNLFSESKLHFHKAFELNPNDSEAIALYSVFLLATGRPDLAIEELGKARKMDPFERVWIPWIRGEALFNNRLFSEAIAAFEEVVEPINDLRSTLAACYAQIGEVDTAKKLIKQYLSVAREEMPAYPGERFEDWKPIWKSSASYSNDEQYQLFLDSLSMIWPE